MRVPETLEKFSQVRRALNLLATQQFRPLGLGMKQAIMLFHLKKSRRLSPSELGRATETDPAAISRAIECLVKKGWVERRTDSRDRRKCEIALTRAGDRLAERVHGVVGDLSKRMIEELAAEEIHGFNATLDRIRASLTVSRSSTKNPSKRAKIQRDLEAEGRAFARNALHADPAMMSVRDQL